MQILSVKFSINRRKLFYIETKQLTFHKRKPILTKGLKSKLTLNVYKYANVKNLVASVKELFANVKELFANINNPFANVNELVANVKEFVAN